MEKIGSEMADVIAWLTSVANLLNIDLEAELLKNIPGCVRCADPCPVVARAVNPGKGPESSVLPIRLTAPR